MSEHDATITREEEFSAAMRYAKLQDVIAEDAQEAAVAQECFAAAKEYLAGTGIVPESDTAARYRLCVNALTLHFYDHRDAIGDAEALPKSLRTLINQLKAPHL